jgi:hypothetical protein
MREIRKSGSVGASGQQRPEATRLPRNPGAYVGGSGGSPFWWSTRRLAGFPSFFRVKLLDPWRQLGRTVPRKRPRGLVFNGVETHRARGAEARTSVG